MATKPRVLLLDVETAPGVAYVWSLFDKYTPIERLIEPGRIICAAFKVYGKAEMTFVAEWKEGTVRMLRAIREAILDADAVVTYNGDKFDLPRLNGEFVRNGIEPLGPVTSIDLYRTIRKLGFMSGKLAYVAPMLKIGEKTNHAGFSLWRDVLSKVPSARNTMERYNIQDVRLLGRLYKYLRPYIPSLPHLRDISASGCPACGSKHVQKRGYRRTKTFRIEKLQCQSCGAWSSGTRSKVK